MHAAFEDSQQRKGEETGACEEVADGEEKEMNFSSIFSLIFSLSLSSLFTHGRERTERERKEESKKETVTLEL